METDLIITLGIFFFCGAILTFWVKKRWKKPPEDELRAVKEPEPPKPDSRDFTPDEPEPEPPEK